MTTKELIRAEIKKRRLHFNKEAEKYQALNNGYSQNCYGARDALRDLENFLDTLPDEPVTDCHELEEAARAYSEEVTDGHNYRDLTCGFIAGAEWQKAKMMEGAVEGVVWWQVGKNISIRVLKGACKYLEQDDLPYKVRMIILPEEDEQ